jgi:murein DD-endopeptidase MepM/ murein hydrolase activator NlpD
VLPALTVPLAALSVTLSLFGPSAGPNAGSFAAPPPVPASTAPGTAWTAPVEGPVVVLRRFDPPPEPWLPGHRGVDLDADVGDAVLAAGAGTVTWAAPIAGRGVVVVRHADGRRTTYEPVDPSVSLGDAVEAGDPLGAVAPGVGHCGGVPSCLHWGLRRGEDYLDPMLLLRRGRPVLLP